MMLQTNKKPLHIKFFTFLSYNFLFIFLMYSCSTPEKNNCGDMEKFIVDHEYAKKMGLPEVEFSIMYPKNFKTDPPREDYQNYHYNYFLKWDKNEIQTEAISLCYSTVQKNSLMKDALINPILLQAKQMYEQLGFTFTEDFIGKDTFDGKEYYQFRATGTINNKDRELVGEYKILCLIVEPELNDKNGLFVMMVANQDSEVKNFTDFSSKGCISSIWKSLKFEY